MVDQSTWETMTEDEQEDCLHELCMSGRNFMVDGLLYEQDSNLGPVTTTFGGSSGKPTNSSE